MKFFLISHFFSLQDHKLIITTQMPHCYHCEHHSPLSKLSLNIFQIIINYFRLSDLPKIFASHNLNFNAKIMYDASPHEFDIHDFHIYTELFSNLTLKGINIAISYQQLSIFPQNHPTKLSIIKLNCKSLHFDTISHKLRPFTNITKLHLSYSSLSQLSLKSLQNHTHLSSLELNNCDTSTNYSSIKYCPNLRTIRFSGEISYNFILSLTTCPKLKTLELKQITISSPNHPISLPQIQIFKITPPHFYFPSIQSLLFLKQFITTMPNLKRLHISNYISDHTIQIINNSPNLTHLKIIHPNNRSPIQIDTSLLLPKFLKSIKQ